ncbi:lipoprotein [Methylosinus sp. C49]|uniref:XdhC family protein n=1 Tax=Methylosinus sp. C49 TaxID=2699395 RepID=UPI0013675B7E|nr:XdhC family protein [Methylosinus sp. C49]BBU63294.1 lipoprotein [Methylosinus sp. C49]
MRNTLDLRSCEIDVRPALSTDRPIDIFRFLRDATASGHGCALVTLVEIVGGAARGLGAHMAVRDDGAYCGFVSGGCVEAAVAQEAVDAIREGADRMRRYGEGSPYFDIVLPCGGGVLLAIHVVRDRAPIDDVLRAMTERRSIGLVYRPKDSELSVGAAAPTGWRDDAFLSMLRPEPRILLSGRGLESRALTTIAAAAGLEVVEAARSAVDWSTDADSAVVLLHHDIDQELPALKAALRSDAFYIGCLGSSRTHVRRIERLRREGFTAQDISRIRAPIGLFGPARDARSIAVSVLAEILSWLESRKAATP